MALWRLYYHLVWTTKNRQSLINSEREARLYPYIVDKANSLSFIIHAIGGTENHLHLVASISPKMAISDFVQRIKGSSAHYLNKSFGHNPKFVWQEGYGVFSLGSKQLDIAVNYVLKQKEHHQQNTIITALEQADFRDNPPTKPDNQITRK